MARGRVIVVGAGGRGRTWLRELSSHPAWAPVAVVDTDPRALDAARALAPDTIGCTALDEALERVQPDAVLVATPPDDHVAPVLDALGAGAAVLVEKPFATSLDDARAMVEASRSAGRPLLVGQNHRYLRSHRTVRRVVAGGALGDVRMLVAHYYRPPHDLAASLARLPHRVLWGMAVHHLDAFRYVLGQDAVDAFATTTTLREGEGQGSTFTAELSLQGGARIQYSATYESSGHQYFESGQEFYQRVMGTRATLHVLNRWLVLCADGRLPRPVRRGRRPQTEEAVLLDQFDLAIRGAPAECSGEDNLKTMAIVDACLRSTVSRRVEPVATFA